MRYFLDTEFIESERAIELISIGVVAQDGREFYAENRNCDLRNANDWCRKNVLPLLENKFLTPSTIATRLLDFIGKETPEFWGYCAAFDHVLLTQLFKETIGIPKHFPYYTNDLAQLRRMLKNPELPNTNKQIHHALSDARWNKDVWDFLTEKWETSCLIWL